MLIRGLRSRWYKYLINKVYAGPYPETFEKKRRLLLKMGYQIGEGTKVVGPIECWGKLIIGENVWVGKNFKVNGNGTVIIGDNCDIAPEVTFNTGGHEIGSSKRRAGKGNIYTQIVGDGCWIGTGVVVINETKIGKGTVVAACACVVNDIPANVVAGGVPAKVIRQLDEN